MGFCSRFCKLMRTDVSSHLFGTDASRGLDHCDSEFDAGSTAPYSVEPLTSDESKTFEQDDSTCGLHLKLLADHIEGMPPDIIPKYKQDLHVLVCQHLRQSVQIGDTQLRLCTRHAIAMRDVVRKYNLAMRQMLDCDGDSGEQASDDDSFDSKISDKRASDLVKAAELSMGEFPDNPITVDCSSYQFEMGRVQPCEPFKVSVVESSDGKFVDEKWFVVGDVDGVHGVAASVVVTPRFGYDSVVISPVVSSRTPVAISFGDVAVCSFDSAKPIAVRFTARSTRVVRIAREGVGPLYYHVRYVNYFPSRRFEGLIRYLDFVGGNTVAINALQASYGGGDRVKIAPFTGGWTSVDLSQFGECVALAGQVELSWRPGDLPLRLVYPAVGSPLSLAFRRRDCRLTSLELVRTKAVSRNDIQFVSETASVVDAPDSSDYRFSV